MDDPLAQRSWWNLPNIWEDVEYDITPIYALQAATTNMSRLEPRECIGSFIDPLNVTRSVVVVAANISSHENNGTSLIDGWITGWDIWSASNSWICAVHAYGTDKMCTRTYADTFADRWMVGGRPAESGHRQRVLVDYCLVDAEVSSQEKCGLHYSAYVMAIVCTCTFTETLLILFTWLYYVRKKETDSTGKRHQMIVTMGDAIAEFLKNPTTVEGISNTDTVTRTPRRTSYGLSIKTWRKDCFPWFRAIDKLTWSISVTV